MSNRKIVGRRMRRPIGLEMGKWGGCPLPADCTARIAHYFLHMSASLPVNHESQPCSQITVGI